MSLPSPVPIPTLKTRWTLRYWIWAGPFFGTVGQMYWTRSSCILLWLGVRVAVGTELIYKPECHVDCYSFFTNSRVRTFSPGCFARKPLPLGMRSARQQRRWPDQQCQSHWRTPVNYDATGQRGCYGRANGVFLGDGGGHGPAQLPVAEERYRHQRRDFFGVYHSAHDSFRQSRAVHRSGCQ